MFWPAHRLAVAGILTQYRLWELSNGGEPIVKLFAWYSLQSLNEHCCRHNSELLAHSYFQARPIIAQTTTTRDRHDTKQYRRLASQGVKQGYIATSRENVLLLGQIWRVFKPPAFHALCKASCCCKPGIS